MMFCLSLATFFSTKLSFHFLFPSTSRTQSSQEGLWWTDRSCNGLSIITRFTNKRHAKLASTRNISEAQWRGWAAGQAGAHSGMENRILLNYTTIENAHKVHKKTFDFLLFVEVQQTFSFPFSQLRHYEMPECFQHVNNCCFWPRATVLSCYKNW